MARVARQCSAPLHVRAAATDDAGHHQADRAHGIGESAMGVYAHSGCAPPPGTRDRTLNLRQRERTSSLRSLALPADTWFNT